MDICIRLPINPELGEGRGADQAELKGTCHVIKSGASRPILVTGGRGFRAHVLALIRW